MVSFLGLLVGAALLFLHLFSQPCGFSLAQSHLTVPTWQAGVLRTCLVLQGMVFYLERASHCRVWSKTEAENPTKVSPALTSLTWLGLSPPEGPPSTLALPASHSHFSPSGGWAKELHSQVISMDEGRRADDTKAKGGFSRLQSLANWPNPPHQGGILEPVCFTEAHDSMSSLTIYFFEILKEIISVIKNKTPEQSKMWKFPFTVVSPPPISSPDGNTAGL